MVDLVPTRLTLAVLDPRFIVSVQTFGGSDKLCVLQVEHPTHGLLSFVWPMDEARKLHEALEVVLTC